MSGVPSEIAREHIEAIKLRYGEYSRRCRELIDLLNMAEENVNRLRPLEKLVLFRGLIAVTQHYCQTWAEWLDKMVDSDITVRNYPEYFDKEITEMVLEFIRFLKKAMQLDINITDKIILLANSENLYNSLKILAIPSAFYKPSIGEKQGTTTHHA